MEFYTIPCASSSMTKELVNDLNKNDFESFYVPYLLLYRKASSYETISFVIDNNILNKIFLKKYYLSFIRTKEYY